MAAEKIAEPQFDAEPERAGPTLVVGLGATGLSVARFLAARGRAFEVVDSRAAPPGLAELQRELPNVPVHLGPFDPLLFAAAGEVILSPGVSFFDPVVVTAREQSVPVCGDIELFARTARAPVVAITGSNGKSTVTALVGAMAQAAGRDARVGGNFGTPALDLLGGAEPDLYILELSSFQLETTDTLDPRAAVVLNVSADHLDRHANLEEYAALKARVFRGGGVQVINADDPLVAAMANGEEVRRFTLEGPSTGEYGLRMRNGRLWLVHGETDLIAADELRIAGRHNLANALAALALGEVVGLPLDAMRRALREFPGLPHRCQWVARCAGADWYDDSKGTNVGATLAALDGMPGEKVVLIAGGQGKGQAFEPLAPALAARGRAVVLIGEDAPRIEAAIAGSVPHFRADSMDAAVGCAAAQVVPGDTVLLSPACASFDMFSGYAARGDAFAAAVRGLGL